MARYLFAAQPLSGHFRPFVPLVRRLIERGHSVGFYTGGRFRQAVEDVGAEFVPMSPIADFDERDLETAFPGIYDRRGIASALFAIEHLFLRPGPIHADDVERHLTGRPARALIVDVAMIGPVLFAKNAMPPRVGLSLFPLPVPSRDLPPFGACLPPPRSGLERLRDRLLRRVIPSIPFARLQREANAVRADRDLTPLPENFMTHSYAVFDHVLHASAPGFDYPRTDLADHIRYIGPLLPDPTPAFDPPDWWRRIDEARNVVLVTQGTFARDFSLLVEPTLRALAREDVLVVVAGASVDELSIPVPRNAQVEAFVPFDALLPHVDVFVTNGGYGGVQLALSQGVPIVVAGQTEEKGETAARIAWSGVGLNLKKDRPKEREIVDAVREVLEVPGYRRAAERLAREMAEYRAVDAATELLETL